ncbi:D-lysine 5,6-aminomutase subunit alpha [Myxococcota bacterium]|nr:D-lysine 5,6-aminomutase subunit alpha [Myxococcota bacterium]
MYRSKLNLDTDLVAHARETASRIAGSVMEFAAVRTTTSVERATLRLLGVEGADADGVHLSNRVVDSESGRAMIPHGLALPFADAMIRTSLSPSATASAIASGEVELRLPDGDQRIAALTMAESLASRSGAKIEKQRDFRRARLEQIGEGERPLLYVIVATGNIYEDVDQAKVAARAGAQIIAVIRSTAQSLLDYIPEGPTTEGFGGTFATQANFKIMRDALDEVSEREGRYIRLCNYASGLCMPEMSCLGALERLDVMLNDALYGILFRNINMQRTLTDQRFARLAAAAGGFIINTGEDNYLTTADASRAGHTVLASDLINEQIALRCGLKPEQLGLGHAMQMNPWSEDMFVNEIAMAQLVREVFPGCPIKYMPPTKYMTGNIFRGHVQDAMFNMTAVMTDQGIHLLGMMTEAMHTPHIHDRWLALESAGMIRTAARHMSDEIEFRKGGLVQQWAGRVLREADELLTQVGSEGLFSAISRGVFADVKRGMESGRGLDGVAMKADDYCNPVEDMLARMAGVDHDNEVAR